MNELLKEVKEIYGNYICMLKSGAFYHCYNKDAVIMSYLFEYKLKNVEQSRKECGFPLKLSDKVIEKLKNKNINYIIIDDKENYQNGDKCDFKEENKYNEFYNKANIYMNYKIRINNINEYLLQNIEQKDFIKLLGKIEETIY